MPDLKLLSLVDALRDAGFGKRDASRKHHADEPIWWKLARKHYRGDLDAAVEIAGAQLGAEALDDAGRRTLPTPRYEPLSEPEGKRLGFRVPEGEREAWEATQTRTEPVPEQEAESDPFKCLRCGKPISRQYRYCYVCWQTFK